MTRGLLVISVFIKHSPESGSLTIGPDNKATCTLILPDVRYAPKGKLQHKLYKAPMYLVYSGYLMERLATDLLGELPMTSNGNKYILVVADYFTKWTESFALPNMEAETVATKIVEVVSRFGVPAIIHSDQGPQNKSNLFREMCKLLDIKKTHTTLYHPQSDGMVERFNRTLKTMLSVFVNEHHTDWDVHLPFVMMEYRSSMHETTGLTTNMMMLGQEVSIPLDLMYEMPPSIKEVTNNKWAWCLQARLENAH